jgi:hypothetical protein
MVNRVKVFVLAIMLFSFGFSASGPVGGGILDAGLKGGVFLQS